MNRFRTSLRAIRRAIVFPLLFFAPLAVDISFPAPAAAEKPKITKEDDLPRYEYELPGRKTTVGEMLHAVGVHTGGRRVAVNGHPAHSGTGVVVDDEVTVVPRVERG